MSLRFRILTPLTLALAVLLGTFVYAIVWYQSSTFESRRQDQFQRVVLAIHNQIQSDAEFIQTGLEMIAGDERLQEAWRAKDRRALLERAKKITSNLFLRHHLTHFYFHLPDKSFFLAVNQPENQGGAPKRVTLALAGEYRQTFYGLEFGSDGTVSLRVVHPWRINGKVAGFIEMGEDIGKIIRKLAGIFNLDFYVFVRKDLLERGKWEGAMRRLGRAPEWDRFPSVVLTSRHDKAVPEAALKTFISALSKKRISRMSLSEKGRSYHLSEFPLREAGGRKLGDIILASDNTEENRAFMAMVVNVIVLSSAVGIGLFALFHFILGKVEAQLQEANDALFAKSRQAEDRAEMLKRASEIEKALSSSLEPGQIFRSIVRKIREAIPCERCVISSLEMDAFRRTNLYIESDIEAHIPPPRMDEEAFLWLIRKIYETRKPLYIPDLTREGGGSNRLAKAGFRSTLIVPILQGEECVAHISVSSTRPHAFSASDEALLSEIAGHVAPAIRNAALFQEAEERAARLVVLNDLNNKIAQNHKLGETLSAVASAMMDLLKADHARIFLHDPVSGRIELKAHDARAAIVGRQSHAFLPGEGFVGMVFQTGAPALHADFSEVPSWVHRQWAARNNIHAVIAHPLRVQDRIIGVALCMSRQRGFFSPEDLDLLGALSSQAAIGIENTRLHEEERRSRNFLMSVVGDNADPIVISDATGRIILWNTGAEGLYGHKAQEALGQPFHFIVPKEGRDHVARTSRAVFTTREGMTYETRFVKKDRTTVPVSVTLSPVVDEAGRVTAVCSVHKDLTERIRVEEELNEARDAALASTRLKSEFLANMSHEIRTPLNGVIGMTGLLIESDLPPRQMEFARTIQRSGNHLLTIINDILDFSKIEAGKLDLVSEDFDLRRIMEEAIELFAIEANEKGLDLPCLIEERTPVHLVGDPGRLRQILANYVGNAVKFTSKGEVFLQVRAGEAAGGSIELLFEVSDTGPGIAPGRLSHVFDSFTQAGDTHNRRHSGTGLGLAISRRLAQIMGGETGAESTPGEGSRFWFTARFGLAPSSVAQDEDPAREKPLTGARVLIVEDGETARRVLQRTLEGWGASCRGVSTAAAAMEKLAAASGRGASFDLMLLDADLPGLNSYALAGIIHADPAISSTRIVLRAGRAGTSPEASTDSSLVQARLAKPLRPDELRATLAHALGAGDKAGAPPAWREPAAPPDSAAAASPGPAGAPGGRILVVEDNEVNQMVAVRLLENWGFRADVAANGLEALERLEEGPFDLILMDCRMPEMDGFETTQAIRRKEGGERHIPIIAMTAYAMKGDRELCLAAGMDDYIVKPVRAEEIRAVLGRWLPAAPSGEGAPSPPPNARNARHARHGGDAALRPVPGRTLDDTLPIDPSVIGELFEIDSANGAGILDDMLCSFLRDAPGRLDAIAAAMRENDAPSLRERAHALKGSCLAIGAARMGQVCHRIEICGKTGRPAEAGPLASRLREEYRQVQDALASRFWEK